MAAKRSSKKAYIARRRRRVREVFIGEGLSPREIAAKLVAEEVIVTTDESLESAVRIVRGDVAAIRAAIDDDREQDEQQNAGSTRIDAVERELARLRNEQRRQERIADGEPGENGREAMTTTATKTPNGDIVTIRPKWPPGVRQKASVAAALIAERISKLEISLAASKSAIGVGDRKRSDDDTDNRFVFRFPNVTGSPTDLDTLIALNLNLDRVKVN